MRLRTLAAAAVGGIGVTTVANRAVTGYAGELRPALSGSHHTHRWRGFDIKYEEAGDPDDPDVLLLHALSPASSNQEFEQIFDMVAEDYHVLAPDLPGFGRSDRPPLTYSSSLYTSFVADFAEQMTTDAVCVASGLTAGYAVLAQRNNSCFRRLDLICPMTKASSAGKRPRLRGLLRSPVVGTALFNVLTSKPAIRWTNQRHAFYSPASITEHDIDYQWRTAHQPNARFAPASLMTGFLDLDVDLGAELAKLDVPVTLIWGREAIQPPLVDGKKLADRGDTRLVVVDESRTLPHAEHPGPFLEALLDELPLAEH